MSAARVPFTKLEALGNDFVLIDGRARAFELDDVGARRIADRRRGVGCDQVLVLRRPASPDHDVAVEIRNADGSPAEQCGNGMRAIGLWLNIHGELSESATIETPAGPVGVRIEDPDRIRATLTVPDFSTGALSPGNPDWRPRLPDRALGWHGLRLGNPHLVVEWPEPPGHDTLLEYGRPLADDPALTSGANIGLAFVAADHRIDLRVFERGAGPTPACGSGACAAACALIRAGRVASPVQVRQPGGTLVIHWDDREDAVAMTGPANAIFEGTLAWPITPQMP